MGSITWEYLTLPESDRDRLARLGSDGWELAATGGDADGRLLYLKRPALDLRERVTLDQRRRLYESLGLNSGPQAAADRP
jgi:hypothetical protein